MSEIDDHRIPWPGPRPYDEKDWGKFFGRDSDLTELQNRVRVNKLTVLLGGSGTGKTSLIRAGLVPLLRQERYHPQGDQTTWPVLLLRRWGNVGSSSLEEDLLLQLESGIEAIRLWGERVGQERASLEAVELSRELSMIGSKAATVLETIESLARAEAQPEAVVQEAREVSRRGGLILIFDQFEEQLRASRQARAHALELIGNLVRSKAPTRVLLSLRREYQYALRPLELIVGGLSGRSYFLEPLKKPTVVEVVTESSAKSNIPITGEVANQIIGWLAYQKDDSGTTGNTSDKEGESHDETGQPDLLQLQAVLREITLFALDRKQTSIDETLLDTFASSKFSENGNAVPVFPQKKGEGLLPEMEEAEKKEREKSLAQKVLGGALERWIESALERKGGGESSVGKKIRSQNQWAGMSDEWEGMSDEDIRLQVRHIAVRLAPRLSSGDYKVSQEEKTLFRQALGDEIARLGFKDPELRSKIRIIDNEEGPPRVDWEALPVLPVVEVKSVLSGLARVKSWTPKQTGDKILLAFKETLHRLAAANILQYTTTGADKLLYWELVHDQLGPIFTKWADRQRGTWEDCKNSLVVCSGIQPIAVPVPEIHPPSGLDSDFYVLKKISWRGCGVESSKPGRLTLRNVCFEECHLVGTIFDSVDFIGCTFVNCDLDGGLFRNCSFKSAGERRTKFVHCDANIAVMDGSIEGLEFHDCQLLQPTIRNAALIGNLLYTGRSRVVQGYFNFNLELSAEDTRVLFDAESRAAMCLAAPGSFSRLKFENPNLDFRNYSLEGDYTVRETIR